MLAGDFLKLESRVIAGALAVLEMDSLDEDKEIFSDKEETSKEEKMEFLRKTATAVVDRFVIDQERNDKILTSVQLIQQYTDAKRSVNAEGRYPCRYKGCQKTFAFDGKHRRQHEMQHYHQPEVNEYEIANVICDTICLIMECYCSIYGMEYQRGDGERVKRCWKFFLMYLKHQGTSANKYSLEALYLMFQLYALLSPKESIYGASVAKWLAHLPFTSEAAGSSLSENFLNATRTQSSCEKSKKATLCRKSWVFPGYSGFLPQGKLTGWVRQKGPTVIGICCCGDPALVGKAK
jgi:hypothetical protein